MNSSYYKKFNALSPEYKNETTIEFEFSVGSSEYVNGESSFLSFRFDTNHDTDVSFNSGSACNFIEQIMVYLPNGQILDVLDKVNLYNVINDRYNKSEDYLLNLGSSKLYNYDPLINSNLAVIGLGDIMPLFNSEQLISPHILNKMRIRILLANPLDVFVDILHTDWIYTIKNPVITMNMFNVTEKMSLKPYEVYYQSYFNYSDTTNTDKSNIKVLQSRQNVVRSICRFRVIPADDAKRAEADRMLSDEYRAVKYQWLIGNQPHPLTEVATSSEAYYITQRVYNNDNNVSLEEFNDNDGLISLDMRTSKSGHDGLFINNDNIIRLDISYPNVKVREVDIFVNYWKVIIIDPISPEEELAGMVQQLRVI